ncbi:hypothetical protein D8Y20_10735 [Mariprofundus sp. EBB-1]|nr:hypothetical protein D8Y20_10735 [Mariprofundus sp. EBB-1]
MNKMKTLFSLLLTLPLIACSDQQGEIVHDDLIPSYDKAFISCADGVLHLTGKAIKPANISAQRWAVMASRVSHADAQDICAGALEHVRLGAKSGVSDLYEFRTKNSDFSPPVQITSICQATVRDGKARLVDEQMSLQSYTISADMLAEQLPGYMFACDTVEQPSG